MSMYSMLFGESKASDVLLAALGMERDDFYRYRDCYLTEDRKIAVYTRGGGNNRRCYCGPDENDYLATAKPEDIFEWHGERHVKGCARPTQAAVQRHPAFLYMEDDDFDNTYATLYFRIPEDADRAAIEALLPEMNRDQRWQIALDALRGKP